MHTHAKTLTMMQGCIESMLEHPGHAIRLYTRSPAKYMKEIDLMIKIIVDRRAFDVLTVYRPDGVTFTCDPVCLED